MDDVDPALRRESLVNNRDDARTRILHGALITASVAVALVAGVLFGDEVLLVATLYTIYGIVDGPRRILGGVAMYAVAANALRRLELSSPAPPKARLIQR